MLAAWCGHKLGGARDSNAQIEKEESPAWLCLNSRFGFSFRLSFNFGGQTELAGQLLSVSIASGSAKLQQAASGAVEQATKT